MDNINLNKIKIPNSTTRQITTMFDVTKANYEKFVAQVEQTDFKTAYTRYMTEHGLLKNLLEFAKKENRADEIKTIESKINEISKILKEQKGIIIK